MKKSRLKPKIKTTKLTQNPLFIKFLNWTGDRETIKNFLETIYKTFQDIDQKAIVKNKLDNLTDEHLDSLSDLQVHFKRYIDELISSQNVSEMFLAWLNNAFKYITEEVETYVNDKKHTVRILDPSGKWLESFFCYNFILTLNYFGSSILKKCPVCSNYFCHKGKYAKYCSEGCKLTGGK